MHHQLGLEHNHVADLTAQDGQEKVNNNLSSPPEPNVSPWDDDEPSPYVSRGQLEMAFKRIRREGAQIIAIVGSPGMGKTRLAEYLTATEKPSGEVAVRIDTGTDKAIERSMYEELVRINQSHKALQGPAIEHAFRELLVSDKAPHYVLLDNLQDITLLRRIHGPGIKSAIVLTARAQVPGIRPEHHIEVEGLSDSEGIELVSKLLPNATKADAFKLVHILGGNALAIVAACGFLKDDPGLTIDKLCVKLPETAALLFDGVTVGNYPALTAIYRETIIRIRDVDPQAYSLLRLVVFLADSPIFINLLAECFKVALADSDLNTEHLGVVWRRGLGYLKRHYLVSIENSNIGMHQLTRAIMGHLLAEHKLIVSTHLYDGILQGCRELFRQISAKDEEPLNLFGVVNAETGEHLMKVLATIRSVSSSSLSFVQLWPEVVAQLLSTIGYDPFDFLVVILPTGESDYSCSIRRRSRKEIEASQFMASLNVEEMRQVSGPSQIIALRPRLHRFKAAQDSEILLMPTIVAWRQEDLELDQNGDRSV